MFTRRIAHLLTGFIAVFLTVAPGAASTDGRAAGGVLVYASVPAVDVGDPGPNAFAELFTVRADGTASRRLTRTASWEYGPSWSPNGSLIVYSQGDPYCHASWCEWGPLAASIWVASADGHRHRPLTDPDAARENSWLEAAAPTAATATRVPRQRMGRIPA